MIGFLIFATLLILTIVVLMIIDANKLNDELENIEKRKLDEEK